MAIFELSPFEPTGTFALLELEAEEPIAIAVRQNESAAIAALVRAATNPAVRESESASIIARVVVRVSAVAVHDDAIAEPDVTIYVEEGVLALGDQTAEARVPSIVPSEPVNADSDERASIQAVVRVRAAAAASQNETAGVTPLVRVQAHVTASGDESASFDGSGGAVSSEPVDANGDETVGVAALVRAFSDAAGLGSETVSATVATRVHGHIATQAAERAVITALVRVAAAVAAVGDEVAAHDNSAPPPAQEAFLTLRFTREIHLTLEI